MVTLADSVLSALVEFIQVDDTSSQDCSKALWSYPLVELVVRLPTDPEAMIEMLGEPLPPNDILGYETQEVGLSLLYVMSCLDSWIPIQAEDAFRHLVTFLTSMDNQRDFSDIGKAQALCLYGVSSYKFIHASYTPGINEPNWIKS